MAVAPLTCSSINKDICLVYTKTTVWDCRIIEFWMAWYASTVLQSRSHDPIMIHQHINISPFTWDLCTYLYISSIEYWTRHLVANSDELTWVDLIKLLAISHGRDKTIFGSTKITAVILLYLKFGMPIISPHPV